MIIEIGYDLESYPNFFSCVFERVDNGYRWIFEVSDRMNQATEFYNFVLSNQNRGIEWIGFNNFGYDYQVIHHLIQIGPGFTAADAYFKTDMIINGNDDDNFKRMVWGRNHLVPQIDLYKINHFDNVSKRTSLKEIEFNSRSADIGDMPVKPGELVSLDLCDSVIRYNAHDTSETNVFARHNKEKIEFRRELVDLLGPNVMNWNDTKIGKQYFIKEMENDSPGITGTYEKPNQTKRPIIRLKDIILPQIGFVTPELQNVLSHLKATSITQTKAPPELKGLKASLGGIDIFYGAGGGHASLPSCHVRPEAGWSLIDVDVTSFYPNLAIKNWFHPEHLSETFCFAYKRLFDRRQGYAKKTAPNEMLKLALNGVYGDSAEIHSAFYDPQYTMSITINGQLLLSVLLEQLVLYAHAKPVQLNTDGVTVLIHDSCKHIFDEICKNWEEFSNLQLEYGDYSDMWIRDVNSYMARFTNGKLKRIGCYAHETARENPATREIAWHKNHSALVVPKAAEKVMVKGIDARTAVMSHDDPFDFFLRLKIPGKSYAQLVPDEKCRGEQIGWYSPPDSKGKPKPVYRPYDGEKLQKVSRYHMAINGQYIQKIMPELKKKPGSGERTFAVNKGMQVAICDRADSFNPANLDYDWYINEVEKVVIK